MLYFEIKKEEYKKIKTLLPDICSNVCFSLKEEDTVLEELGLCDSAPCIVEFDLTTNEFDEMLEELNDIEIEAFNTHEGTYSSKENPAHQKYLKYGCLYDILFNAKRKYYPIGKVKYIGKSFGVESLTNGKEYDVLEIDLPFIRIIDDSEEDYLYSISMPAALENLELCGRWEIVEDKTGILKRHIK